MGDTGRHLTHHGQLGGLHELLLGGTQFALGSSPFTDFKLQGAIGLNQVSGSLSDHALKPHSRVLQGPARGELLSTTAPPQAQHPKAQHQDSAQQPCGHPRLSGCIRHARVVGQQGQGPVLRGQLTIHGQHGAHTVISGHTHQAHARPQVAQHLPSEGGQLATAILARTAHIGPLKVAQGLTGVQPP